MQAKGKTMEEFMAIHQDKSKNALEKAHTAAFQAWHEQLRADEAQFTSDRILFLGQCVWQIVEPARS